MQILRLGLKTSLATGLSLSFLALAAPVQAEILVGLVSGKTLVTIDTEKKAVIATAQVQGASLMGMDVRPSDNQLYAVTTDGNIVIVDAKTGKLIQKSVLSEKMATGVTASIDFNPVADRMRIIGSDGMSLRVNVEDGKATVDGALKYAETDASKGKPFKVTAASYSNSFAGTKETALYDIDVVQGHLLKQAPPNDGILNTVGSLGIKLEGSVAFDIASDGKGGNSAFLLNAGRLHMVDLTSGAAKSLGSITGLSGDVTDIAVITTK